MKEQAKLTSVNKKKEKEREREAGQKKNTHKKKYIIEGRPENKTSAPTGDPTNDGK